MLKLRTVFPYKVNDRLGDGFVEEDTHVLIGSKFSALSTKSRISHGRVLINSTLSFFQIHFKII